MNFAKAYVELLDGKKIRRKEWESLMHLRLIGEEVKAFRGEITTFYNDANFIVSNGWYVVDGDGAKMPFIQALEELKKGKCISLESMKDAFIFVDSGNLAMCKPVQYEFMPSYKCMCSTDWETMK